MNKTIGHLLTDPGAFFSWIDHTVGSFAILNAAIESGILRHLHETPADIGALAQRSGLPADKLARVLHFLAAEEIVTRLPDGRYEMLTAAVSLSELEALVTCHRMGMQSGLTLTSALRDGITPYHAQFGKPVFEHLADEPETAAAFLGMMGFLTRRFEGFLHTQHKFEPFKLAVDIGGNHGELLLGLLDHHPDARGIVFDLPEVVAQTGDRVRKARHGGRVEIIGGSFFENVPAADLYLLKMILHDWDDAECIRILRTIRTAIEPGGRIAVIDFILPETPIPSDGLDMDIAMLIWDTGKEHKLSEFEALFDAAGFRLERVTRNPHGQSVIEAVPV